MGHKQASASLSDSAGPLRPYIRLNWEPTIKYSKLKIRRVIFRWSVRYFVLIRGYFSVVNPRKPGRELALKIDAMECTLRRHLGPAIPPEQRPHDFMFRRWHLQAMADLQRPF